MIEIYPGPDGRVRNVKVKTAESEYLKPVTKIAVIALLKVTIAKLNEKDYALFRAKNVSIETSDSFIYN